MFAIAFTDTPVGIQTSFLIESSERALEWPDYLQATGPLSHGR